MAEIWLTCSLREMDEIINAIEILRRRLEYLANTKLGFDDPEVLAASQELDAALNEYFRCLEEWDGNLY